MSVDHVRVPQVNTHSQHFQSFCDTLNILEMAKADWPCQRASAGVQWELQDFWPQSAATEYLTAQQWTCGALECFCSPCLLAACHIATPRLSGCIILRSLSRNPLVRVMLLQTLPSWFRPYGCWTYKLMDQRTAGSTIGFNSSCPMAWGRHFGCAIRELS